MSNHLLRYYAFCCLILLPIWASSQQKTVADAPRLIQKITRYLSEGKLIEESVQFDYDEQGRLIAINDSKSKQHKKMFVYIGESLQRITSYNEKGEAAADFSDRYKEDKESNRVVIDYSHGKGARVDDTVQISYAFAKGGQIQEIGIYVHRDSFPPSLDTRRYAYDENGNLTAIVQQNIDGEPNSVVKVLKWDDQQNPFFGMPPSQYIFLANDFPFNTQSLHNPVEYVDYLGRTITAEVTYSKEGYPLTYKRSTDDFISDEFVYDR
jgi:YD repeat-containing protein